MVSNKNEYKYFSSKLSNETEICQTQLFSNCYASCKKFVISPDVKNDRMIYILKNHDLSDNMNQSAEIRTQN